MTAATRRRASVLGLALATALTLSFCPADATVVTAHGDTVPEVADLGPTSFTVPGPYAVGETTLKLKTNKAPVEVWFPATPESVEGKPAGSYDMVSWMPEWVQKKLPADFSLTYPSGGVRGVHIAPGRFPLVVFSHGYAGFRDQSSFLTAWLATWGFVVAAPDQHSRDITTVLNLNTPPPGKKTTDIGDLRATITLMRAKNEQSGKRFFGHVDMEKVAAVGHSAGAAAVEALAAVDPRVGTFVSMAGASVGAFGESKGGAFTKLPKVPGMIMAATDDGVVGSASLVTAYGKLNAPKRLVMVGGGHHAFSDICEIGAGEGGLVAVAQFIGIPVSDQLARLANDGCSPPDLPPTEAWPAIRQAVVAQLRNVFAFDTSTAGLDGLVEAFPGVVAENTSEG